MPEREGRRRLCIENVSPEIDGGRFAIKRVIGECVAVEADVFADGHDSLALSRPHGTRL
jgi:starch synthase (maltosyl-transferring)